LWFDEADDVLANRSALRDVRDRYANHVAESASAAGYSPAMHDTPDSRNILERPKWSERRFRFDSPAWMLADHIERLRGLVPRLAPLVARLNDDTTYRQHQGTWSIAQNIGHLSDVEDLWQERVEILRQGRETYAPADLARFKQLAERHQMRPLAATVAELSERRARLVETLSTAPPALQLASAFHERLQTNMRLVDWAQFAAEHDDHHLTRIRALRAVFGFPVQ
jgi:uncharacterized damage-inducible protein DinB